MASTRTLITGVAGFTGGYVARLLSECGHEIHGIAHERHPPITGVHQSHEVDLADLPGVERIVRQVRPHYVIHLAGVAFVAHSDVDQIYRSNVLGTRQLLEAIKTVQQGGDPPGLGSSYYRLRAYETVLPKDAPWFKSMEPKLMMREEEAAAAR